MGHVTPTGYLYTHGWMGQCYPSLHELGGAVPNECLKARSRQRSPALGRCLVLGVSNLSPGCEFAGARAALHWEEGCCEPKEHSSATTVNSTVACLTSAAPRCLKSSLSIERLAYGIGQTGIQRQLGDGCELWHWRLPWELPQGPAHPDGAAPAPSPGSWSMGTVTPSSWASQGQGLCSGLEVESLVGGFMSLTVSELLMALLHHDLCIVSRHSLLASSGLFASPSVVQLPAMLCAALLIGRASSPQETLISRDAK